MGASEVAQWFKNLPANEGDTCSILLWRIPQVSEQLNICPTTTGAVFYRLGAGTTEDCCALEPELCNNKRSYLSKEPAQNN